MLSELEQAVLGVVWLRQPCTPYQVRKVFEQSLSSHWSGSGGAIYPLLRRLEREALLRSTSRDGDGRGTRLYTISRHGTSKLRTWLRAPLPAAAHLMTMDPLRVRVRFFEAIRPTERLTMIQDARAKLRSHLVLTTATSKEDKRNGDTFRYLAHRSGILAIRAQMAWLSEVEAAIDDNALSGDAHRAQEVC